MIGAVAISGPVATFLDPACKVFRRPAYLIWEGVAAMLPKDVDSDELLQRAGRGEDAARQRLLAVHRDRLRRMVAVRMDRRLAARLDPSDVVQEVLADAGQRLDEYLRDRPTAFYPWLRGFAWQRLVDLHRHHIQAQRRTVAREEPWDAGLPDESAAALADRLAGSGTSPSRRLIREEQRQRVREALARLAPRDREVLVLRHLEGLSTAEVAAVLGVSPGAVMTRHTRALVRLRGLLADDAESEEVQP
jgi:RNA polymerase sigma-70 factor (ECF subfamily)